MSGHRVPLTRGPWKNQRSAADVAISILEMLVPVHADGRAFGGMSTASILVAASGTIEVERPIAGAPVAGLDPRYASPEVMSGRAATPGDDCHAVGAILYELLAGAPPPQSTGTSAVPNLLDIQPGVTPQLAAIVMRAISPDPTVRYQLAGAFLNDLVAIRSILPGTVEEPTTIIAPPPPAPGSRTGPIIAIVALTLLILGTLAYFVFRGSDEHVIPAVANQPVERAQQTLVDAGFRPTVAQETSTRVAGGRAIRTEPAAGERAKSGSTVLLVVSGKPTARAIPSLIGQEQSAAAGALTRLGFTPTFAPRADSTPAGTVVGQSPPAGSKAPSGTTVALEVSSGPEPVRTETVTTPAPPSPQAARIGVPAVTGQSIESATQTLTGAGLAVGTVTRRESADQPAGTVLDQNPPAGTQVDRRSQVSLLVADAPPTP